MAVRDVLVPSKRIEQGIEFVFGNDAPKWMAGAAVRLHLEPTSALGLEDRLPSSENSVEPSRRGPKRQESEKNQSQEVESARLEQPVSQSKRRLLVKVA